MIVQAIQNLLNAMRQPGPFGQEFLDIVHGIIDVVQHVIKESRLTLSTTELSANASLVLKDLSSVCLELDTIGKDMTGPTPSNGLKQKMASSSYEIAKFIKELLSLLE